MSDYWTESFTDASQLEVERANAEWDEWQAERVRDRQISLETAPPRNVCVSCGARPSKSAYGQKCEVCWDAWREQTSAA